MPIVKVWCPFGETLVCLSLIFLVYLPIRLWSLLSAHPTNTSTHVHRQVIKIVWIPSAVELSCSHGTLKNCPERGTTEHLQRQNEKWFSIFLIKLLFFSEMWLYFILLFNTETKKEKKVIHKKLIIRKKTSILSGVIYVIELSFSQT